MERAEKSDEHRAFYEEVKAERDALAKDLAKYPRLAGEIAAILSRLQANNAKLAKANNVKSADAEWLDSAEDLACGKPRFPTGSSRLAQGVKLPAFKQEGADRGPIWPAMSGQPVYDPEMFRAMSRASHLTQPLEDDVSEAQDKI